MAEASRLERLERRVRELEEELAREKGGGRAPRARIESMSPEVTDSNPYRCGRGARRPVGWGGCAWEEAQGPSHGVGDGEEGGLWGLGPWVKGKRRAEVGSGV